MWAGRIQNGIWLNCVHVVIHVFIILNHLAVYIQNIGEKSFEILCWRESTAGKLLECKNLKTR